MLAGAGLPEDEAALQWGRDVSVAVMRCRIACRSRIGAASMGPRRFGRGDATTATDLATINGLQWGRDDSVAVMMQKKQTTARLEGFNGAATFRSR